MDKKNVAIVKNNFLVGVNTKVRGRKEIALYVIAGRATGSTEGSTEEVIMRNDFKDYIFPFVFFHSKPFSGSLFCI